MTTIPHSKEASVAIIKQHTPQSLIADGKLRLRQMWADGTAESHDIKDLQYIFESLEVILAPPKAKKHSWADAWGLFDKRKDK